MYTILLNPVTLDKLLIVVAIVAALAVLFAALIVLVSKLCAVPVDQKAEQIKEHLAGANCGGCGYAGCTDFAKALSEGKAAITSCGPTSPEGKAEIAKILGQDYSSEDKTFAVVHCAGGQLCLDKFNYIGNDGCDAQASFMGGKKLCPSGCLGGGTCESACVYDAIKIVNGVAVTDKALCESCGLCVKNCPKKIISLIPKKSKVYIACSSVCKGKSVMDACKAGCIGCGLCAKVCPEQAITLIDNLPVIDYKKCSGCQTCVGKCPRKCIKTL